MHVRQGVDTFELPLPGTMLWVVNRAWAVCLCWRDRNGRPSVRGEVTRLEWVLLPGNARQQYKPLRDWRG